MLVENEKTKDDFESLGYVGDLVPEIEAELSSGSLVSRASVEDECDLMLRSIRSMWNMEPDQVMRLVSALSARATELEVHLHRAENQKGADRLQWKQIRTMQIQPILEELDRQFRLASRLVEVRRQDIDTMGQ